MNPAAFWSLHPTNLLYIACIPKLYFRGEANKMKPDENRAHKKKLFLFKMSTFLYSRAMQCICIAVPCSVQCMLKRCAKEGMYQNTIMKWPVAYPQTDNLAKFYFWKGT